ncbi:MAG: Kdo domain containing protein [Bacteroidetes bacterium]|nr:Kdo domain containing protein [Bacteroidota bacterium]
MYLVVNPRFEAKKPEISGFIENFDQSGKMFVDGKRNKIKLFELSDTTLNIKSFKVPNFINRIAYKFFRKSKAHRSYEFAMRLLENGIGTPEPIAYSESSSWWSMGRSFYVSEQLSVDLTYRELVEIPNYPDAENILRQFVRFTFLLHEKGIEFLDHSPGNTLIKKREGGLYDFYLVDLNRMNFHASLDFETRMKNMSHLTPQKKMVELMSQEYALLYSKKTEVEIAERMWFYTDDFQRKFHQKIRLKKKLKFWK